MSRVPVSAVLDEVATDGCTETDGEALPSSPPPLSTPTTGTASGTTPVAEVSIADRALTRLVMSAGRRLGVVTHAEALADGLARVVGRSPAAYSAAMSTRIAVVPALPFGRGPRSDPFTRTVGEECT